MVVGVVRVVHLSCNVRLRLLLTVRNSKGSTRTPAKKLCSDWSLACDPVLTLITEVCLGWACVAHLLQYHMRELATNPSDTRTADHGSTGLNSVCLCNRSELHRFAAVYRWECLQQFELQCLKLIERYLMLQMTDRCLTRVLCLVSKYTIVLCWPFYIVKRVWSAPMFSLAHACCSSKKLSGTPQVNNDQLFVHQKICNEK